MLRIDPSEVGFRRFAQLRGLAALLATWPRPRLRRLRVLDADADVGDLTPVVPEGAELIRRAATPRDPMRGELPHFDPAVPEPGDETFQVVIAGPTVSRRGGPERRAVLAGLADRAREVLVVFLPPAGALGELACELVAEFLGGFDDLPRDVGVAADHGAPPPPDLEDLQAALGGRPGHVELLPATDPVGGLALSMLEVAFRRHPAAPRLVELLNTFHNTALVEAGPALRPLYQDMALLFPGRSDVPRALRRQLEGEPRVRYRPRGTDLSALQLVLELERRARQAGGGASASEEPTEAPGEGSADAPEVAAPDAGSPDGAELAALRVALEAERRARQVAEEQVEELLEGLELARGELGRHREALAAVHEFVDRTPLLKAYLQQRGPTLPGGELLA